MTRFAAGFVAGALLTAAALVGVALLDRDATSPDDDTLHEWKCPKCDMGCGARGPEGDAWVRRTAEDHRFRGCQAGILLDRDARWGR